MTCAWIFHPSGESVDFSPGFESEELIAYEIGYREQPVQWFSWDLALFYNQYENLESFRSTPVFMFPITNANDLRGEGYGGELSAQAELMSWWKLSGWYSFLQLQLHPGATRPARGADIEGSSPHNQVFLMSTMDVTCTVQFDLLGRYVDNLPYQQVPHYISLDVRLAWRPNCEWELAVVGQNLLDSHHPEFGGSPTARPNSEIERGVYGMVTRRW